MNTLVNIAVVELYFLELTHISNNAYPLGSFGASQRDNIIDILVKWVTPHASPENLGYIKQRAEQAKACHPMQTEELNASLQAFISSFNDYLERARNINRMHNSNLFPHVDGSELIKTTITQGDIITLFEARYLYWERVEGTANLPLSLFVPMVESVLECGLYDSVNTIYDNVLFNVRWGEFDEFKEDDETDDEFIERAYDNGALIVEDERLVLFW